MTFVECSICGHTFQFGSVEHVSIAECPQCRNGITVPRPTVVPESNSIWLETYGGQRLQRRNTWRIEAGMRLNWLHLYQPQGSLLEIGCGTGEFLEVALQQGHEAYGIEPSIDACKHARDLGVLVIDKPLEQSMNRFKDYKFDSIAMWHSLEHLTSPVEVLMCCHELLSDEGNIFIEVPNYDSLDCKRLGMSWHCADPSQHIHHFSKSGITYALSLANLRVDTMIEFSPRIYWDTQSWKQLVNQRLLDGVGKLSNDYLRVVASKADA